MHLTRRSTSPEPVSPMRLSCDGLDRCHAHTSATWTCFAVKEFARPYERAVRACAHLLYRTRSLRSMVRHLCVNSDAFSRGICFDHPHRHDGRHA